jgi:hypothetical protein
VNLPTNAERRAGRVLEFVRTESRSYEYRYDHVIGPALDAGSDITARLAMSAMISDPNRFFPFSVIARSTAHDVTTIDKKTSLRTRTEYDLVSRGELPFYLPPGRHPIVISAITPTSFTFTTLPGHFDPEGSTITFTTWVDDAGRLHLEQYGTTLPSSEPDATFTAAPALARLAWNQQASNLTTWWNEVRRTPELLDRLWQRQAAADTAARTVDVQDAVRRLDKEWLPEQPSRQSQEAQPAQQQPSVNVQDAVRWLQEQWLPEQQPSRQFQEPAQPQQHRYTISLPHKGQPQEEQRPQEPAQPSVDFTDALTRLQEEQRSQEPAQPQQHRYRISLPHKGQPQEEQRPHQPAQPSPMAESFLTPPTPEPFQPPPEPPMPDPFPTPPTPEPFQPPPEPPMPDPSSTPPAPEPF